MYDMHVRIDMRESCSAQHGPMGMAGGCYEDQLFPHCAQCITPAAMQRDSKNRVNYAQTCYVFTNSRAE